MSYEQQNWVTGNIITAEKLNHIENGIADASSGGGGMLVVRVDHTEGTFPHTNAVYDKTWQEVNDALARGERVVVVTSNSVPVESAAQEIILGTLGSDSFSAFGISAFGGIVTSKNYYACSADGYLQTAECSSGGGEEEQP